MSSASASASSPSSSTTNKVQLTEEQRERIRINRERALAKRKQRELERAAAAAAAEEQQQARTTDGGATTNSNNDHCKRTKLTPTGENQPSEQEPKQEEEIELEEWEIGLSDYVTKKEAKEMYCVPDGTLEVCQTTERDNPHHKSWNKMKLYYRSEIRRKSRKRWGSIEALQNERNKREEKKLENTLRKSKRAFQSL